MKKLVISFLGEISHKHRPYRPHIRLVISMSATMLSRRLVHRASQVKVLNRLSSSSANPSSPVPASPSSIANQAPNYPTPWSTSQKPRPVAFSGPRFEQTFLELQPNPLSAMALIENEPIRVVHGRKAVCDGGE